MATKIDLGKYQILHENGVNLRATRWDEPWRDLIGDNLILALVDRIERLEKD